MTEAVEFEVPDPGSPNLGEGGDVSEGPDANAQAAIPLMPVPGWTQDEAAGVVGGLLANATLVLYYMRWQKPPALELWPAIAGDPPREFPLMGAGLAPVLDFVAPKGSPQAIGVSISAGLGEVVRAMATRWPLVNTPPARAAAAGAPAPAPAAAAPAAEGEGFRFRGADLRVLERAEESAYAGVGLE